MSTRTYSSSGSQWSRTSHLGRSRASPLQVHRRFLGDPEKRIDHARIELPSPTARDLRHGSIDGPRTLVRAIVRQCVEHIGDRRDATGQWDLLAGQPRVAVTVPSLVVGEGDLLGQLEER
jgi:hypothetical protein